MTVHAGIHGVCHWCVAQGQLTDADVERFEAHVRMIAGSLQSGRVVLEIVHSVSLPNPMQRKRLVEAVQSVPSRHLLRGHAVVTNTAIARGVLQVVNWFVAPDFPESVFSNPGDGVAWLVEQSSDVDGAALIAHIAENTPGFEQLRW